MAIEDYLPQIFTGTPSMYQGLLTDPKDRIALERRANLGGLLSAGAALAQGMSPQGYRRSALQNVLTALAAGYGGAAQTYESGINQMGNVMKLQQSKRQLEGLQKLAEANPDLAYLASVSPEEFVKQVSARERMKMYGLGGTPSQAAPAPAPVSAPAPATEVAPSPAPIAEAPAGLISGGGGGFVGGNYGSADMAAPPVVRGIFAQTAPAPVVTTPATSAAPAPVTAVTNIPQQAPSFVGVSPENKAEAARLRRVAAIALQNNDTGAANFLKEEADRLDPKEQVFFRDGKAFSTTRGQIADVSGKRVLPDAEAISYGLDPKLGKWKIEDNIPSLIPNTGVSPENQKAQLIAGLPSQLANLHPTLQQQANALISRAGAMDKSQIVSETERILSQQSKILGELNPQLQAAGKAKAPQVNVYTGDLSKTTVSDVEKSLLSNAEAIGRLNSIYGTYSDEYLKIPFRAKQEWTNIAGKFKDVSPKDRQVLTGYYQFKQNSLQNLNQTIKALTGAAMGVQEADRIIASLPNAGSTILGGDSPVEFEAKLSNAIEQTKYALARQTYALKSGIKKDAWEKIPLSDMPSIVNKRADEIAKAYKLDPNKEADKQTIKRQLAAEFGIPF
jgi:hypothetical protein